MLHVFASLSITSQCLGALMKLSTEIKRICKEKFKNNLALGLFYKVNC